MNLEFIRFIWEKGGPTIGPLLFLSIISIAIIVERLWFWTRVLISERPVLNRIMDAAARNWDMVAKIARDCRDHPIGNYLYSPLRLAEPDPEVFHLALESAADDQLALMRKGDKTLEAIIALAPLLGLLGTVLGLINSLKGIQLSDLGTSNATGVTLGISEALISTATGLIVAILSLAFYRLFQGFWFNQVRIFRKAGSDLEVIYRQRWLDTEEKPYSLRTNFESSETSEN